MQYRLAITVTALLTVLNALSGPAQAQDAYPSRRLSVIVPYNPGATPDIIARLVAPRLQAALGQGIVILNRPGAGSIVGTRAVITSPPDGYTIGIVGNPQTIQHLITKSPTYVFANDVTPISNAASGFYALIVNPATSNFSSIADLIKYAKANPGKLKYGSGGIATSPHLVGEWFNSVAGVDILHVPYSGPDQQNTALLRGDIEMGFTSPIYVASHVKAGKLKGLAVTLPERDTAFFPTLPTLRESKVDLVYTYWIGFFGPAGMPQAIAQRLSREIAVILKDPQITEQLAQSGLTALGDTPEQFKATIDLETKIMTRVIETARITPN